MQPNAGRGGGGGGTGGRGGGRGRGGGGGGGNDDYQSRFPPYIRDREEFERFLKEFEDPSNPGVKVYQQTLQKVADREEHLFFLHLDHLIHAGLTEFAGRVNSNVLSYQDELCSVIDKALPPPTRVIHCEDAIDFIAAEAQQADQPLPSLLTRRYELIIIPPTTHRLGGGPGGGQKLGGGQANQAAEEKQASVADIALSVRELKAQSIGTLSCVRGICVSSTAVRPKLSILTSVCEVCAEATFQHVIGDRITPQLVCQSARCKAQNAVGRLLPQYKASKFVKFQELRIQELPGDVPKGAIPRTVRVMCEGEQTTRAAAPGQTVRIVGVYIPDPGTGAGNEAFRASTMVKTRFRALYIELEKRGYSDAATAMQKSLDAIRSDPDREAVIEKMTRSIAPEIWGMEDVKKALLCLLIGGSSVANGAVIRSDLNMCMMGDPGVAKSQLLKWIATVAPRSVFTTGRGSSGVGLTAAVTRDPHTGETVLEGGALVLSDNGICCIDEFDKMDETDRTSLHEVMEQQSVSIAKAGIITSLNARTSILAASNPKFGRWKRNATPAENVNLPPALLSRFDILWVLLDEAERDRDNDLSMHVTHVHVHGVAPGRIDVAGGDTGANELANDYFSRDLVRAFVGEVKRIDPIIDGAAERVITDLYVEMRKYRTRQTGVVTPRTLLSLIRISQALARLRFSSRVQEPDVREAARLLQASKASLERAQAGGFGAAGSAPGAQQQRQQYNSSVGVYAAVKEIAQGHEDVSMEKLRQALTLRGVTEAQLQSCLTTYRELGVLSLDPAETTVSFVTD